MRCGGGGRGGGEREKGEANKVRRTKEGEGEEERINTKENLVENGGWRLM